MVEENLAIVDLGSNSTRMAITEIAPDGRFRESASEKRNGSNDCCFEKV